MIDEFKPKMFVEIGSGNSTRFARFASQHLSTDTHVTSIDAYPEDTIKAYPDALFAQGLEEMDLRYFEQLSPGDIVWMDGSHRAFSNTDVTVFFLDVIPRLQPGVIIGVHGIPLPWDYPPSWEQYYFNELFVMCAYLIGSKNTLEYLYPAFYINNINLQLREILQPIWDLQAVKNLQDLKGGGGAFWFRQRH
jgi:hypothetical protein